MSTRARGQESGVEEVVVMFRSAAVVRFVKFMLLRYPYPIRSCSSDAPTSVERREVGLLLRDGDLHSKWPAHKNTACVLETRVDLDRCVDVDLNRGRSVFHTAKVNTIMTLADTHIPGFND
jgi:hypothetical protein